MCWVSGPSDRRMQRAVFLVAIAVGLIFGLVWSWPTAGAKPMPGDQAIEVEVERGSDGHFYADAMVNGQPVRFLIDTGSSAIALTVEDARKAGIAVDPADYELLGQGASGIVRGKEVTLDTLAIDSIGDTEVKAVVVEGASVSLLGLPFLNQVDEIVIGKGKMTLRDAG